MKTKVQHFDKPPFSSTYEGRTQTKYPFVYGPRLCIIYYVLRNPGGIQEWDKYLHFLVCEVGMN